MLLRKMTKHIMQVNITTYNTTIPGSNANAITRRLDISANCVLTSFEVPDNVEKWDKAFCCLMAVMINAFKIVNDLYYHYNPITTITHNLMDL